MPFTGSEATLKTLIVTNMQTLLPDPAALPNLEATAQAMANAIVAWILASGGGSIVATVGPGIAVTGTATVATVGSPTAQAGGGPVTGATSGPGVVVTSSLV